MALGISEEDLHIPHILSTEGGRYGVYRVEGLKFVPRRFRDHSPGVLESP